MAHWQRDGGEEGEGKRVREASAVNHTPNVLTSQC